MQFSCGSAILGGYINEGYMACFSVIAGGGKNTIGGNNNVILGGKSNSIDAYPSSNSVILGGNSNSITFGANMSTIMGNGSYISGAFCNTVIFGDYIAGNDTGVTFIQEVSKVNDFFSIPHPDPSKKGLYELRHKTIESPSAEKICIDIK